MAPGVRKRRRRAEADTKHVVLLVGLSLIACLVSAAGQSLPACSLQLDASRYNPVALATPIKSAAAISSVPLSPFRKELSLRFMNESVYYRDVDQDGDPMPIAVRQQGFGGVYASWDELSRSLRGSLFSIFEGVGTSPEDMYRQVYPENALALFQAGAAPMHLHADDSHYAVWVDCDRSAPAAAGCWYDLQLFDTATLSFVPLSLPAASQRRVHRLEPSFCERYVTYREHDPATNASSVWVYYLRTRSAELVGGDPAAAAPPARSSSSSSSSYFSPSIAIGPAGCRAMWLETRRPLALDPDWLLTPQGPADDVVIHLLSFPAKERAAVRPAEWSRGPFTILHGAAISGGRIAVVVSRPGGSGYALRTRSLVDGTWREAPGTEGPGPLVLGDCSEDGFLYWAPSPSSTPSSSSTSWALHLIKYAGTPEDPWFEAHCVALPAAPYPLAAALYKDILLFAQADGSAEAPGAVPGGRGTLYRLDLDKDNDRVFGACMDDNVVLYIAYGLFMSLLVSGVAVYFFFERSFRKLYFFFERSFRKVTSLK
eukprot:tig00021043_g17612.t1